MKTEKRYILTRDHTGNGFYTLWHENAKPEIISGSWVGGHFLLVGVHERISKHTACEIPHLERGEKRNITVSVVSVCTEEESFVHG